jgi:protein TonB
MLHPFISVPSVSRNSGSGLAMSAIVHVGLLCAAVWSTGVVRPARLTEAAVEHVRFADLPVRPLRRPATRSKSRRARPPQVNLERVFQLPVQLAAFDLVIPEPAPLPDFQPSYPDLQIGEKVEFANDVLHLGVGPTTLQRPSAARYNAYDEDAVERLATPARTNPKPRYPSRMRQRGIESNFVVYFVVDTTGLVDTATVELPSSVDTDFTTAVSEVLTTWRFVPAELGGRRVRQRVLQPFSFLLVEQYSSIDHDRRTR